MKSFKRIVLLVCMIAVLMSSSVFTTVSFGGILINPISASETYGMNYTGTNVPVYNRITCGNPLGKEWASDGYALYIYNYTYSRDLMKYTEYLKTTGWQFFDYKIEGETTYYYCKKDGMLLVVSHSSSMDMTLLGFRYIG